MPLETANLLRLLRQSSALPSSKLRFGGSSKVPLKGDSEVAGGGLVLENLINVDVVGEGDIEVLVELVDPGVAELVGISEVELGLHGGVVGELVLADPSEPHRLAEEAVLEALQEVAQLDGVDGIRAMRVMAAESHLLEVLLGGLVVALVEASEEVSLGILQQAEELHGGHLGQVVFSTASEVVVLIVEVEATLEGLLFGVLVVPDEVKVEP